VVGGWTSACDRISCDSTPTYPFPLSPLFPPLSPQIDSQKPIDWAKTQEIKDLLAVAAGLPTPGMNQGDFLKAAADGDLAKVQLAVETHKMDPNECKDTVSASHSPHFAPCACPLCSLSPALFGPVSLSLRILPLSPSLPTSPLPSSPPFMPLRPSLRRENIFRKMATLLSIGLHSRATWPWCSTWWRRPRRTWRRKM